MSALREQILDSIDIVDLVQRYVAMKKWWKNWIGLCPFHKENSPSFTVAEDKQIFKCFGCGKWWNAITFFMEIERLDYWDAVQHLAKDLNIDIKEYTRNPEKQEKAASEKEKHKLMMRRSQRFFLDSRAHSSAQIYSVEKRELSEKVISDFSLGYAPNSHYDLIQHLTGKGFTAQDIVQWSIGKQWSNGDTYAFFRHRLMFPIHNHMWDIVGFGARALDPDQNPKYLNSSGTPLYDKSKVLYGLHHAKPHLSQYKSLIVVEWYMDVIALAQYGLPIGIATCGTSLTPDHIKLVRRHAETIYLAFDNDSAGFDATMRAMKLCYGSDLFPKIITLPEWSKDLDEYLHVHAWEDVFEQVKSLATDGWSEIANRLQARYDLDNPVLRKKALHLFFELLHAIQDYTIFTMYLDQLSTLFKTDGRLMLKQYKLFLQKDPAGKNLWRRWREEQSTPPSHPSETQLIQAGLVDEFFESHVEYEKIEWLLMQCLELDGHQKIQQFNPEQFEQDNEISKETQLRWEHQWEGSAIDKKTATVIRILQKRLNTTKRHVLKRSDLSGEQKQEVLNIGR